MKKLMLITLLTGMILGLAGALFAEEGPAIGDPLAGVEKATPVNWNSEKQVWKGGEIDALKGDQIVINDSQYRLRDITRFCNLQGGALFRNNFSKGTEVTYVLKKDRQTIVTLIKGRAIDAEKTTQESY